MAEDNPSVDYNPNENSCFGDYNNNNKDIGDKESIVPDSDPDSLNIEVSSVASNEVSSDHTNLSDAQGQ